MKRLVLFVLLCGPLSRMSLGQNVPIAQWETHFNYLSAKHVVQVNDHIFCASHNGLFSINTIDKQIKTWSKSDGLTSTGISSMAFDQEQNLLLLAYRDGNVDLVYLDQSAQKEEIISWPIFSQNPDLPENKNIKRVIFRENLAYLCTGFGIVILDTKNQQVEETYRYIGANGTQVAVSDIAFTSDSLFAVTSHGILATSMSPAVNRQYFANWKTIATPAKAVAIAVNASQLYIGCAGKGLYQKENGNWKSVFPSGSETYSFTALANNLTVTLDDRVVSLNQNNEAKAFASPLFKFPKESIQTNVGKFWVADAQNGLLHNENQAFQSFTALQADTTIFPRKDSSVIDLNALSWTRLPEYLGGGILVKNAQNQQRVLTTNLGSGSLPSSVINSLALDVDGNIWFASDRGVGYFVTDDILNAARVDAVLPVYGQRKLFANEKCTAIAIEPGNRKWIGTRNGLYLFNEDGTELIQKITASESPLPSDSISALQFDPQKGILFIDTPNGMVSFRSNSTTSSEDFSDVKIFPNPVHPGFGGTIGITGLMTGSVVKITELSGRLIYETKSQGGTASWNLTDYTGRRAKGGIYMVLIVTSDGNETFAGKLAVIN
ncbi:PorZ beta-propeller-like domain-containing protein [Dyadobacter psychrophilus]|uniref:Por secretion system C-terminal sorting domain-containing protein n=1 Tax=Dyadobacter psychrophilus TaxID=651661 RepID=A0A1T5CMI5_9BACT|nr:two-component regulator propeller domain-containing protein [Dyadobacter psychrophilus]SKB60594.1 Por secretion system C-terminal sorting domain-containing protein [Dyadobacter psychrophilus]